MSIFRIKRFAKTPRDWRNDLKDAFYGKDSKKDRNKGADKNYNKPNKSNQNLNRGGGNNSKPKNNNSVSYKYELDTYHHEPIKFPTISKSTLKKIGIGTALAGGTAVAGKLGYDEYKRRELLKKVADIREKLEKKYSEYNPDEGVIRVRRPHIEISSSESSSSYDSENPDDNYYYENNKDYDSDTNPDGYEEELIATPRGESKKLSSILEKLIGDKEETKEIGKLLLTNMTGTAAGMILGKHIIDKFKKNE